jgi:hypothetical protein
MTKPLSPEPLTTATLRENAQRAMREYGIEIVRTAGNPTIAQQEVGARAGVRLVEAIEAILVRCAALESQLDALRDRHAALKRDAEANEDLLDRLTRAVLRRPLDLPIDSSHVSDAIAAVDAHRDERDAQTVRIERIDLEVTRFEQTVTKWLDNIREAFGPKHSFTSPTGEAVIGAAINAIGYTIPKLEAENAALRAAAEPVLRESKRIAEEGGCTDGGCFIAPPKGQHTNGGCRCADRPIIRGRLALLFKAAERFRAARLPQTEKGDA